MTVWSEEGHLYYKSRTDDPTVCGIYIIAKPEQTVHVYFDYVDVPCSTGGLIAVSARVVAYCFYYINVTGRYGLNEPNLPSHRAQKRLPFFDVENERFIVPRTDHTAGTGVL